MNLKQAVKILDHHQKWRLRIDDYMVRAETLTQAICIILEHFEDIEE